MYMDALALLRKHEEQIRYQYGVFRIGIFGSFIRGEERPDSDVDVLVEFKEGQETFNNYMDLKFYLEDLFQRNVDLVIRDSIKRRLRDPIENEVVYA
jgi:predicted nucleotidyltransferase